jgi:ribosomal protein L20
MKDKSVELNRKTLSEIAINDNASFKSIVDFIKK